MLNWSRLSIFVPVVLLLVLTPGPNTMFIIGRSLHRGYRAGLVSCLGISLATLIHIAASAVGLTGLLASSAVSFNVVKYAGAGYLILIGLKTVANKHQGELLPHMPSGNLASVFYQGFWVNLLNPKTALFFLAFLPQFVDRSLGRIALQVILLGTILVSIGTSCDCAYALVAGRVGKWLRENLKLRQALRYVAGSVYILLGTAAALKSMPP